MRVQRSEHPATAVEEEEQRCRAREGLCTVNADGQLAFRTWDRRILDCRDSFRVVLASCGQRVVDRPSGGNVEIEDLRPIGAGHQFQDKLR